MTYRVSNNETAAECQLPTPGDTPEHEVWEEIVNIEDGGLLTSTYVLRAAPGIPWYPESDARDR